ncbi:MAG: DUF2948 family protein [Rhizobiales bacterium]|nr:DUF2948 family protein [Hyphomicrobiales bacterium]
MAPLKLIALDKEDIEVVSAHLQDSIVKVADIHWHPAEHRLVVVLGRFDWETAKTGSSATGAPHYIRHLAALRFDRVEACQCRNVMQDAKEAVLNLLAVEFKETEAPAGTVTLVFSGGGALRLQVECLEAELADLGPTWAATCCPEHAIEGAAPGVDASSLSRH